MKAVAREWPRFLSAVQFLTILPVPDPGWEEGRLARSAAWFPLVGLMVGLATLAVYLIARPEFHHLAVPLALLAMIVLTGALHEDGLADTADGLGAPGRERALEVMADSRIGTFGVLALIFSVMLRWNVLAGMEPDRLFAALLIAPAIGRALMVPAIALWQPARTGGAGALVATAGPREVGIALAIAFAVSLLAGWDGVLALAVSAGVAAMVMWLVARRIGGYTGDTLGAVCQVGEITAMLVLLASGGWHVAWE